MITDERRREVARKLRGLPINMYSTIDEWEKDGLFINASVSDEGDYSQIHDAVFGYFPAEYMHPGDYEELHDRLADLIEPEPERTCRMKKIGGDLVLAGWWECSECGPVYPPCKDEIAKWALRKCPHCGAKVVDE